MGQALRHTTLSVHCRKRFDKGLAAVPALEAPRINIEAHPFPVHGEVVDQQFGAAITYAVDAPASWANSVRGQGLDLDVIIVRCFVQGAYRVTGQTEHVGRSVRCRV